MPKDGAWVLSEFRDRKVRVICECGLEKQYDANALFARIGDEYMPTLLTRLASANGCQKVANQWNDRCKLTFHKSHVEKAPYVSRWQRLSCPTGQPHRPGESIQFVSKICPNGIICSACARRANTSAPSSAGKSSAVSAGMRSPSSWRRDYAAPNAAIATITTSSLQKSGGKHAFR